jgi:1-aminocyclopropane-1-carboxylate deaminase
LADNIDWSLVPQTRVHDWRFDGPHSHWVFLKREDEGQYGITAGKMRKFASILPWYTRCKRVAVIGGANSNHVLAAAILLRERGKEVIPFLKKGHATGTNQFLLSLVVDPEEWQWIDAEQWPMVEEIAAKYVRENEANMIMAGYIPEGGAMKRAIEGAMTLATDIRRNEQELRMAFTDIFIDAGTGMSATGLLLGLYERHMDARVHITLMADREETFWQRYSQYCAWYEELYDRKLPDLRERVVLHKPAIAPSFGSVNAEVLAMVRKYAQRGIMTDPIYSAKHLATVDKYLDESKGKQTVHGLIIHSGGAQSLPGFEGKLARGN